MRGFAKILLEDHSAQLDAEGINYLAKIDAAAGRMDTLIQEVLSYTRVLRAEVKMAPETSMVVKAPPLSRNPWPSYAPTMSPRLLIPETPVDLAPGTSMVVNVTANAPVLAWDWVMASLTPFERVQETLEALHRQTYRAVGWAVMWQLSRAQLQRSMSVVLDGLARSDEVTTTRALAREHGAECIVVLTTCDDPELHRSRVEGRTGGFEAGTSSFGITWRRRDARGRRRPMSTWCWIAVNPLSTT